MCRYWWCLTRMQLGHILLCAESGLTACSIHCSVKFMRASARLQSLGNNKSPIVWTCSGLVYFPPVIFSTGWLNVRILCVYHKSGWETCFLISYLQKSLNQLYSFLRGFVAQTLNPCVATKAVFAPPIRPQHCERTICHGPNPANLRALAADTSKGEMGVLYALRSLGHLVHCFVVGSASQKTTCLPCDDQGSEGDRKVPVPQYPYRRHFPNNTTSFH